MLRGEKIVRDTGGPVEAPPPPAPAGVARRCPPAGAEGPAGGLEPEPQPGRLSVKSAGLTRSGPSVF